MFFVRILSMFWIVLSAAVIAAEPVNTDRRGVLLDGYDVVSYFLQDEPVVGQPQWQTEYRNATLYFSSESNREMFLKSPETYWPQYSGHCANGLSDGHLVRANPLIYRLIDGRLYLFYSWWGKAQWKFDQENQIELATENWLMFSEQTP